MVLESLKWPFKEKDVNKMIDMMKREKSLLELALANENRKLSQAIKANTREHGKLLKDLKDTIKQSSKDQQDQLTTMNESLTEVTNNVSWLRDCQDISENDRERQEILDGLAPSDYASQQNESARRRQPGTGQWLLDSPEYGAWISTEGQTWFCLGIPGTGKTTITSIVVDDLYQRFSGDTTVGICYVYCDFRRHGEQKIEGLMSSLLRQLTGRHTSAAGTVEGLYSSHQEKDSLPSVYKISRTIQTVISSYPRVFIIVDALDECQMLDGCRTGLISELFSIQANTKANLFATSRFIPDITEEFEGCPSVESRATEDDIIKYLDGHMLQLPKFVTRNADLQNEIKSGIVEAVDGMFLLAQLHFNSLKGKMTPKAVTKAPANLSNGTNAYDYAYDYAMERIQSQLPDQTGLATRVLSWITCAIRPLNKLELQHALAVEIGESYFDPENIVEFDDIVSVCAGLVTVDQASGMIRLVHYTTQEYLERTQDRWFPTAQHEISTICTTYLSFDVFSSGSPGDGNEYPLYLYAACHWGYHARTAPACQGVLSFLRKKDHVVAALREKAFWSKGMERGSNWQQMPGLYLAAHFGLIEAAKVLWDEYTMDEKIESGKGAFISAVRSGHKAIVELFLARGFNIDRKYDFGETPLLFATKRADEAMLRLLIEKGANIESEDMHGHTPLALAVEIGNKDMVNLLIEKGANIECDIDGHTPLAFAAEYEHTDMVKLLIEKGAILETKDDKGLTPLARVGLMREYSGNGHSGRATIELLLQKGADIYTRDNRLRTPSIRKVEHRGWLDPRTIEMIRFLIDHGADPNAEDIDGRTPLSIAMDNQDDDVISILLENGAVVKDEWTRDRLKHMGLPQDHVMTDWQSIEHTS